MRWKQKGKKYGDVKIKRKFLWFPQYYKGTWIWLETVYCEYTYTWGTPDTWDLTHRWDTSSHLNEI
jgi:hypothetical protein